MKKVIAATLALLLSAYAAAADRDDKWEKMCFSCDCETRERA